MTKREILELSSQLTHSQPVRDWGEDLHRLFGDPLSLFRAQILKRAHVVQAVCKLHQHDANIVNHRQQHLANILSLLFLA